MRGYRTADIDRILRWAYREELSKAQLLGWTYDSVSKLWDYGTPIDSQPTGSGTYYASVFECGPPHEDALLIHETVSELDSLRGDWHEQEAADVLLGDMPADVQIAATAAVRDYKVARTATVVTFAKIGSRPRWETDVPEFRPVAGPNGKPLWVVDREITTTGAFGAVHTQRVEEPCRYSKKKALPVGARQKLAWEPSLRSVVARRADYLNWHASLTWLAEELRSKLVSWFPSPPTCAALPWFYGEAEEPRILPTLKRAA